jgi:CubicO group peptidase (beta-lactamase class C family)
MSSLLPKISEIFEQACQKRAFPGGVVWLSDGKVLLHHAFGKTNYDEPDDFLAVQNVHTEMLYDVASLTKLFTATAILMTSEQLGISLDSPLAKFLSPFQKEIYNKITLRHLLLHNSGIEIAIQSLTDQKCIDWIQLIANAPLHAQPSETVRYSCTNFFLLARILELWTDTPADHWITSNILAPLKMTRSSYWPQKYFSLEDIAPTEINPATKKPWQGIVHDEAARKWQHETGSTSGNSGLFSTAQDLSKFVELWINNGMLNGQKYFSAELAKEALKPAAKEGELAWRGLGWQIDAKFFMGHKAPKGSAGHTGFTGPTLFFTPQGLCVIILENRVYPTRNGPERLMYHRRIAQALFDSSFEEDFISLS